MTLKTWLILFIVSMAASAEVLSWAAMSGQFTDPNRGRWMALRRNSRAPERPASPRTRQVALIAAGGIVAFLVWLNGVIGFMREVFGH